MFTGIVNKKSQLLKVDQLDVSTRLTISSDYSNLQLGESIAVDGMCITVTSIGDDYFTCDLSSETLSKTISKNYKINSIVNLERALCIGDRLGGHWVSGHVDGCIKVAEIESQQEFTEIKYSGFSEKERALLIPKGSITINGVSLTINDVTDTTVSVMLIPHTLAVTNLSALKKGDFVNVEFDCLAKMVQQQLSHQLKAVCVADPGSSLG